MLSVDKIYTLYIKNLNQSYELPRILKLENVHVNNDSFISVVWLWILEIKLAVDRKIQLMFGAQFLLWKTITAESVRCYQYNLYYYTLRHSLTEIQPCRNVHMQGIPVC